MYNLTQAEPKSKTDYETTTSRQPANSYYVDLSVTSERQNKFIPMSLLKINNLRS